MFINGKKIERKEGFDLLNPYNNKLVAKVPIASKEEIIKAAKYSFKTKKNLTQDLRIDILNKAAKKVKNKKEELAKLITSESGLCLKDTLHEIDRVTNGLIYAAETVPKIEEDLTPKFIDGKNLNPTLKVISEPLDLVLGITPFNHPMNQVAHKVAPAIVAGTAILLKPSKKTPLSAIRLVEILYEAGLPENMINVITTDDSKKFIDVALNLKLAQLVTITAGTETGRYVAKKISDIGNIIKYVPELGGNSSFTILEDADIDLAVDRGMNAFVNSGQRCTSIKRILLHNSIADEFMEKFLKKVERIKYGDPMDPNTDMGTVIDENSAKIIQERVNKSIEEGAKLLYGNKREGALYSPTLLDNVNSKSELVVKETFGPVAPIIRINDVHEAIRIINSVNFKLAAGVMTKSRESAELIANSIHVGQFNWNNNPSYRTEKAPFGGFGDSGNGEKEGIILAAEGMRRIRTFYEH
ncbi:MAG TPA: aldehyde dehydrogenase family protein [Candidatus Nanoarchaeia archaeon]|nr:aldehyde dehydrogenase family protein [Candidatus Nanoarchaeia archaeon]